MNIKLAFKSAAVSLALAIASIPAFCVEPVTTYVPSDVAGALYLNIETLFASPAFGSILKAFDVDVNEMLKSAGIEADDMKAQFVVFVTADHRAGLIANTNGKSDEFKSIVTENEHYTAAKVEFDGAEVYEIKDEENSSHFFLMIVSKDHVQAVLTDEAGGRDDLLPLAVRVLLMHGDNGGSLADTRYDYQLLGVFRRFQLRYPFGRLADRLLYEVQAVVIRCIGISFCLRFCLGIFCFSAAGQRAQHQDQHKT